MPRKRVSHPLLELFDRTVSFRRIAQVMHESHVACRVPPFQCGVEVVCVDCSLALNGEIKLREFQENITNRARSRMRVRAARQVSGHILGTNWCARHFVCLKSQLSSNLKTVGVTLVMRRIERIA